MKNTIKLIGIIAFVAVIGFTMVACNKGGGGSGGGGGGKISGTYIHESGFTYTFSGNTMTIGYGGDESDPFPYEIKDGKIFYTMNRQDKEETFSREGNKLIINGQTLTKK
jgi:hypothetical protein